MPAGPNTTEAPNRRTATQSAVIAFSCRPQTLSTVPDSHEQTSAGDILPPLAEKGKSSPVPLPARHLLMPIPHPADESDRAGHAQRRGRECKG